MHKSLSCGVVITDINSKILMIRGEGNSHWDFPKGTREDGESLVETAIRECEEETGLKLVESELTDLSYFPYMPKKDLYLFHYRYPGEIDLSKLSCSTYTLRDEYELKEADEYKMFDLDELRYVTCNSMKKLLDAELQTFLQRII